MIRSFVSGKSINIIPTYEGSNMKALTCFTESKTFKDLCAKSGNPTEFTRIYLKNKDVLKTKTAHGRFCELLCDIIVTNKNDDYEYLLKQYKNEKSTVKKLAIRYGQERQIEFYLENQNFWDLRRWKIAEQYFGEKPKGMGVTTNTFSSFIKPVDVNVTRSFNSPQQYLMPIPLEETNKNVNLVQNPNY